MTGPGWLAGRSRVRALPPTEPCERCGAESWRTERPGPWEGTVTWLRSVDLGTYASSG